MTTFTKRHRNTLVATALSVSLAGLTLIPSCATSPIDGKRVNRTTLDGQLAQYKAEVKGKLQQFDAAYKDIAKQEQFLNDVGTIGLNVLTTQYPGFAGVASLLLTGTTIGAVSDRLRRNGAGSKPKTVEK